MRYSEFVEVYEELSKTTKRLEKEDILAKFFLKLSKHGKSEWVYLLHGRVLPDYDSREFGISRQLAIKAMSISFGIKPEKILERLKKIGDLGEVAEEFLDKKKQSRLFSSKLSVDKVFENLNKLFFIEGKGAVDKKMILISEILVSAEKGEVKYIIRTLLNDLRIGVAEGTLRDALAKAFFPNEIEMKELIGEAYDLANDYALVFEAAVKGKDALQNISLVPGKPMRVMLPIKVIDIHEAFRVCGSPIAIEHKYDGFRMIIHKIDDKIFLFTRKLENVTKQFPDVVDAVRKYVKGKNFILDSEVVGYDSKTNKYKPFEAISQRIKRKYDIDKLIEKLPVEINIFDVVYYNDKNFFLTHFSERRKLIEKIIPNIEKVIRPSMQFITDNVDEALEFYKKALKSGEEGIMIKKLDAPYKPGRLVGYMAKMKPENTDLDVVIVGAEYGNGKRAGGLTSYIIACGDNEHSGKFLEIGKVSSGLKEKEQEEGTTYDEMTKLLKPLIISEKDNIVRVSPKVVVSVTYQNIQKSLNYSSGFALRFPRIKNYRPDKPLSEIATLKDIEKESRELI